MVHGYKVSLFTTQSVSLFFADIHFAYIKKMLSGAHGKRGHIYFSTERLLHDYTLLYEPRRQHWPYLWLFIAFDKRFSATGDPTMVGNGPAHRNYEYQKKIY